MTALDKYQRIEASGLWRPAGEAQRMDVIASIGDATLLISDMQDRPLTHWSLAAVVRANPGKRPAIYHPAGDESETLEFPGAESEMIDAIEKLRAVIERRRPHPGRLRFLIVFAMCLALTLGATFWLPGAVRQHTVNIVPQVKRAEIGAVLFQKVQRVTGPPCTSPEAQSVLTRLAVRLPGAGSSAPLYVMRDGVDQTVNLPGGIILINRTLVEDYTEPDVVAGFIVAERLRAAQSDPLAALLKASPIWSSFRLLTTGALSEATLTSYAETLLTSDKANVSDQVLLTAFEAANLRATPYAYAVDITGEQTLGLIEADPFATSPPAAVMNDASWLQLQSICGA
ncbi:MAG: hypothetical protein AAFR49_02035 [Pseudomonadota bacterium]